MITPGDHLKLKADPSAVAVDLDQHAHLPLSYQRPTSQVERQLVHTETITGPDGEVTQAARLNRKGKRKAEALERRKFKPATRPLNRHELQQLMLNKYEDSLEAPRRPRSKPRKKKKAAALPEQVTAETTPENSRMRRLARRATERALQAIGL